MTPREKVLRLALPLVDDRGNVDRQAIAAKLGISPAVVTNHLCALRKQGELPELSYKHLRPKGAVRQDRMRRYGVRIGTWVDFFEGLTDEQVRWLADDIPDGLCIAEYLAKLVVDVWNDEKEMG